MTESLSEKIGSGGWMKAKDVKEFIKELKEEFERGCFKEFKRTRGEDSFLTLGEMYFIIDKLAGKDLI